MVELYYSEKPKSEYLKIIMKLYIKSPYSSLYLLMVVDAGRLTEEMRNSYRYLREGFSGKYLALYVIMENGEFAIIVN